MNIGVKKFRFVGVVLSLASLKSSKQATDEVNYIRFQALKCNVVVAYQLLSCLSFYILKLILKLHLPPSSSSSPWVNSETSP